MLQLAQPFERTASSQDSAVSSSRAAEQGLIWVDLRDSEGRPVKELCV